MKKLLSLILIGALLLACVPLSSASAEETLSGSLGNISQEYLDYLELSEEEQKNVRPPLPLDRASSLESDSGKQAGPLPSSYDARTQGYLSPVEDQGNSGSCWTFSATENLENYLNRKTPLADGQSYNFSPRHMEFFNSLIPNDLYTGSTPYRQADSGGNQYLSSSYFMQGAGPVDAVGSMAFQDYSMSGSNIIIPYPTRAELTMAPDAWVTGYMFYPEVDTNRLSSSLAALRSQMKQGVLDYGSLDVGINWVDAGVCFNSANNCYFNPANTPYATNHAVLLVGWDDNYPATNFSPVGGYIPANDGAWIIQNSWGDSVQENGFFYVSYNDLSIYELSTTVTEAQVNVDYDNAYVLDPMGQTISYTPDQGTSTILVANVFDKEPGAEELTAVNIGLWGNTRYEIYVNPTGAVSTSGLSPVASGSTNLMGYLTETLSSPVTLTGKRFSVIVKYTLSGGAVVPLEGRIGSSIYQTVDAPKKSTYLSENNGRSWEELSVSANYSSNACIKAFTRNGSDKTIVTIVGDDSRMLFEVYRTDKTPVSMRADGTFSLAQNTKYVYESYLAPQNGGKLQTYYNTFTTDGSGYMTVYAKPHGLPFKDVSEFSWYFDPVLYCYENELINGVSATSFAPGRTANRAALITVLWRMAGEPKASKAAGFKDVKPGDFCYDAVNWGAEVGITTGTTSETFSPKKNILRQDFAVMLYRYRELVEEKDTSLKAPLTKFEDAGKVSVYAKDAMSWCVANNILSGRTPTELAPRGVIKRSETAAMLQRMMAVA